MARIKQIGTGRKTTGTVDGIVYVTRNGVTYARTAPTMPAKAYKTPEALKRQAVFKMIQMHLKYHLRTIKQTFTPKGAGSPTNRYYALNGKHFTKALDTLAELYVAGETVTLTDIEQAISASVNGKALRLALDALAEQHLAGEDINITDVEAAISAYATEHPTSICIAKLSGYGEVYLTGAWPDTITLYANGGDSTVIIVVAENGSSTTISHNTGAKGKPAVTLK